MGVRFRTAAANLRLDALAAEVVQSLRAAGVRTVLLKGPSVARWLYEDAGARGYIDVDLLVAPRDLARAERTLTRLGFRAGEWRAWLRSARPWRRGDGEVDLHTAVFGVEVPAEEAWEILAAHTETMDVGGVAVDVLAPAARALHLALHVAQHPPSHLHAQSRCDLERGVASLPRSTWEAAAELARKLRADAALAAGLRQVEGGPALAGALGVDAAGSRLVSLVGASDDPVALWLAEMTSAASARSRFKLLVRGALPPANALRAESPLAARGPGGLAAAYVIRLARLARRAPAGVAAWRRAGR